MPPPDAAIRAALEAAAQSPCVKSKRGVAVYHIPSGDVMGVGYNSQPSRRCDQTCITNCNKLCVHAEHRAIVAAMPLSKSLRVHDAVHVKLFSMGGPYTGRVPADFDYTNALVPSGGPSCWQCSRIILDSGLEGFWLFHVDGWKRYEAEEFHRLSLEFHGLAYNYSDGT
jgi:hypothetical protein